MLMQYSHRFTHYFVQKGITHTFIQRWICVVNFKCVCVCIYMVFQEITYFYVKFMLQLSLYLFIFLIISLNLLFLCYDPVELSLTRWDSAEFHSS